MQTLETIRAVVHAAHRREAMVDVAEEFAGIALIYRGFVLAVGNERFLFRNEANGRKYWIHFEAVTEIVDTDRTRPQP